MNTVIAAEPGGYHLIVPTLDNTASAAAKRTGRSLGDLCGRHYRGDALAPP
jgi:hypothetical protein